MFDQLVDAVGEVLKIIAKDNRDRLFAFAAITKFPHNTSFTVVSDGEMFMVSIRKVEQ